MPKKLTTEEFIKRAKIKHGDKYDYSLVEFEGIYKKVKIICPTHGIFEQIPKSHLRGYECKELRYNQNIRFSNVYHINLSPDLNPVYV